MNITNEPVSIDLFMNFVDFGLIIGLLYLQCKLTDYPIFLFIWTHQSMSLYFDC